MKRKFKAAAACMSLMLAAQGIPFAPGVQAADGDILVTDFEDGDVSAFSKRGDTDTSVIAATDAEPHSGKSCMSVTERSNGWNGPSVSLEALGCEPGVQYVATAWVKMAWYNTVNLSMQYTDDEGKQNYSNLTSVISEGGWVQIPPTKFSFSEDMKDVSIYIEGSDKADMWVDDFSLTCAPVYPIEQDIPGLKDVFGDYFKIGGAVTAGELAPKSTKDLILKHYNSITLGNELKPENLLDEAATKAYLEETGDNTVPQVKLRGNARSILNFCRDNHIPVRGHVLVWYSQTPLWFFTEDYTAEGKLVDKDTMLKRMENYIKAVFAVLDEEYPDVDFYAWDVVNEALLDGGKPRNPGSYEENNGSSAWVAIFGDNSFIEPAFRYARKYARPGTKLYYNDFNEYMKVDAMIEMAMDLKEKGLIDGLGLQSHLNVTNNATTDPFPSVQMYANALDKFCATGLDIQITELDATYDSSVANGEKLQAEYYGGLMDAIVKHKDQISAVVFWGTTDDQSWRAKQTPLLFNEDYTAKPCYYSIIDTVEYTYDPATTTSTTATTTTVTTNSTTATTNTTLESGVARQDAIWGDSDHNGDVNVMDAVLLARIVGDDATLTEDEVTAEGKVNCDVTHDGKVDGEDLGKVMNYLAKKITAAELAPQ